LDSVNHSYFNPNRSNSIGGDTPLGRILVGKGEINNSNVVVAKLNFQQDHKGSYAIHQKFESRNNKISFKAAGTPY